MAEGEWVALGAAIGVAGSIIGVAGSILTTWLNAYLNRKEPDPSEVAAKDLLRTLLQTGRIAWKSIDVLANTIGTDENSVRRLLLEIGARGSTRDGRLWALISRKPLSDNPLADDPEIIEDPYADD